MTRSESILKTKKDFFFPFFWPSSYTTELSIMLGFDPVHQDISKKIKHIQVHLHARKEDAVSLMAIIARGEKAWGDLNMYKYLRGGCKEDGPRLFPGARRDRTRGNGHKLKHRRCCLNIRKHFFLL